MWFNKFIKINHKYIFDQELYNKGDFMHEDGHFFTHEELTAKYHVTITKMYLMSLIDAIPCKWRLALKTNFIPANHQELPFVNLQGHDKMITIIQSCDLYIEFLKRVEGHPPCIIKWNERLSNMDTNKDTWKKNISSAKINNKRNQSH